MVVKMQEDYSFDDVLKLASTHGKWQWLIFFLTGISGFFVAFHNMGAVFLAATPNHWCSTPEMENIKLKYNWTEEEIKQTFIPSKNIDGIVTYDSCEMYTFNLSLFNEVQWQDSTIISNYTQSHGGELVKQQCSQWTYDRTAYVSTVISEWDLVCSHKALASTVQSSFMAGVLLGCLIFGWVSDKYGRRKAVLIALVQFVVASILASFSIHYIMFLVLRFISALGDAGVFSVAFVIVTEISGRKSRALLGLQYMVPFSVGFMVLPGIAFYIRDWFWLQLAISIPTLSLVVYFWLLPESPRWLMMQGNLRNVLTVLKSGARINGRTLPSDESMLELLLKVQRRDNKYAEITSVAQKSGNFLDLVRTPILRRRSLVVGLIWFVAGKVYYGLSFSAQYVGTSVYLYTFLAAAVEVPAFFLIYGLIQKFGRKIIFIIFIIISGLSCLLILAVPGDLQWVVTALALSGKFFSTGFYGLIFLYTVELFPTPVRNLAVGTGAMLSRLGSVVAPYIIDLLRNYHESIPMATFGTMCLIAGLLAFYLPETKGFNLPESIEEIEGQKKADEEKTNMALVP